MRHSSRETARDIDGRFDVETAGRELLDPEPEPDDGFGTQSTAGAR